MSYRAKTVAEGWVPIRHGIPSSHNRGCRCDECRTAIARARARSGAKFRDARFAERVLTDGRLVHPAPSGGHGSITAYTSCGCRCDACRAANAAHVADRRRRQREVLAGQRAPQ